MNSKQKEKFSDLQNLVFDGNDLAIDDWFRNNKDIAKKDLIKFIFNSTSFFSFQSYSLKREEIYEELLIRHLAILRNLDLEEQLELLIGSVDKADLTPLHFEILKIETEKDKELIKNHDAIPILLTTCFSHEDFQKIDEIEKILGFSALDIPFNRIVVKPRGSETFYLYAKEKIFKPFYDILINFTSEKKQYLESKGIELPRMEEGKELINKINKLIEENPFLSRRKYDEHVNEGFIIYMKQILHDNLQEKMPMNLMKSKIKKI